jgi:hypothetical protein
MKFPPSIKQVLSVFFDDPEGSHHVACAHAVGPPNGLRPADSGELDYDLRTVAPNVNVRRRMLTRWQINANPESADPQDRGHRTLTYPLGCCKRASSWPRFRCLKREHSVRPG